MTLRAYPRKEEVGGGFRAVVIMRSNAERFESPVLETYEAARHWSQLEAHNRMGSRPYRRASVAGRRGSYYANIWA